MSPRISRIAMCLASALSLATPPALAAEGPRLAIEPASGQGSPFRPAFPALPWRPASWPRTSAPLAAARDCGSLDAQVLPYSRVSLATGALGNSLGTGNPPVPASTYLVSSCGDSSSTGAPGELRYEVAKAPEGSTIDLSGLNNCPHGSIILYYGAIAITQNNLYLKGPGADTLGITGAVAKGFYEQDRILYHTMGGGTLTISGLSISYGAPYSKTGNVYGGCILTAGSLTLNNSVVSHCTARTNGNSLKTWGGGISTTAKVNMGSNIVLNHSLVENSRAIAMGSGSNAGGGGVAVGVGYRYTAYLKCDHCSIVSNQVIGTGNGIGGGVLQVAGIGKSLFSYSTIAGNSASTVGGGIAVLHGGLLLSLFESTVSGNSAGQMVGGVYSQVNTYVYYSTIAFNSARQTGMASGLTVGTSSGTVKATLYDSLLSNNTYGNGTESDFGTLPGSGSVTVGGSNNLIHSAFGAVPAHTITGACPDLGPLRNNGGPTLTHALLSHSPAIASGFRGAQLPLWDQRGPGFLRMSFGPPGGTAPTVPDIGAYEVQQNDIIFNASFDGCP